MGIEKLIQIIATSIVLALASSQRLPFQFKIREAQFLLIQVSKQSKWGSAILIETN